ncbi:beta-ketoacyl-ACP synthase III [Kangiella sediminilitoris]|uniref:Beta-ketoacyl-[acyl-carrier-protein] synthase III n=1 Tax=Kangiella sediminilitoris TaxID=1144748 RepID=A0A1B3B977_9GAMM|nr:beta-ketoacyl-ACP synthase III [Kangiella sediminilitoris]AOE49306.1 3-oxoacyl-[acyl-carrier-protein] synthase 3 [Kangiella sediminilitoris]
MQLYSKIKGVGSYVPSHVVSNYMLEETLDTSHEWIVARTGIEERRISSDTESSSFMAIEAAKKAIAAADIKAQDIDMVIVGTTTSTYVMPSTACEVAAGLGISGATAFDVAAACSGFIYAVSIADKFIRTSEAKCVLAIGVDRYSRLCNPADRNTSILFGDGAGASIIRLSDTPGIEYTELGSDGGKSDILTAKNQERLPFIKENDNSYLQMQGQDVFKSAVSKFNELIDSVQNKKGIHIEDIDMLIPHQANIRIINSVAKRYKLPDAKVFLNVQKYGNTSAASVALALDEAMQSGHIKEGSRVLMLAFGGGLTWGSILATF